MGMLYYNIPTVNKLGIIMSDTNLKFHIQQQKKLKEVRDAMEVLVGATNTMGSDKLVTQGIVEGLENCHRTLQQSFMRCFVAAMKEYGDTRFFDPRNEASVEFAKKVSKLAEEHYFPFI